MALAKANPQWIKLLQGGRFVGRDGRGPFFCDAQAVIAETYRRGLGVIDFNHAREVDPKSPVAGYLVKLEEREGDVWGLTALTENGLRAIRQKDYAYLSP